MSSRSSDPRDKVFGILGVSKFNDKNCAIMPDYNKSVLQVSVQASAAVLKDCFATYIGYQPWLHSYPCPTWVLYMASVWLYDRTKFYTTLYESEVTDAIGRGGGVTPILYFLGFSSILLTVGLPMGRIVASDGLKLGSQAALDPVQFLLNIRTKLRSNGFELTAKKVLSVLSGPYDITDYDYDLVFADIKSLLSGGRQKQFLHLRNYMGDRYAYQSTVFLTDTGQMGLCYGHLPSFESRKDDGTLVAAALFGIQLPFILERFNRDYRLVALAHIDGHTLGDENVEAMGPTDDWRELVRDGKMREYRIV